MTNADFGSRPVVEVDLDALCENFRRLAALAPDARTAGVVKCDAYGLGAGPISRALAREAGCRIFFVAHAEEGVRLRADLAEDAPDAEIFVFHGGSPATLELFGEARLTPILNSLDQARLWAARGRGPAALHIDTGMRRLGAPAGEIAAIAEIDGLSISVLMSHLANGFDADHPANASQRDALAGAAARFPGAAVSLAASGGALLGPAYAFDMVRLGVGLYGVDPLERDDDAGSDVVAPVARLTAEVLQTQDVAPGERVGYGGTFEAKRPTRLATVALGYGDGFLRAGSNEAQAFVGGAPCPVAGRISMDLTTLDVTDAPTPVSPGDRAEFFGPNLPIEAAARACGTIGYELLTRLGPRVARRYVCARAASRDAG